MGLKLHSLQSVWTSSRRLPEGDSTTMNSTIGADLMFLTVYSVDPHLNAQITRLHTLARQGGVENIQKHIDAYLPAVAYAEQNPSQAAFARQMVLSIPDTPQLGTLPDLGLVIRLLLQGEGIAIITQCGFILAPLCAALPCVVIRSRPVQSSTTSTATTSTSTTSTSTTSTSTTSTSTTSSPTPDTHQVALCILLALFLGIYPSSIKFPPFHVRVALYRRVHCLLTHGTGTDFCQKHPALLTLALMEYCSYVLPTYLPVEYDLLAGEGMDGLFTTCPLMCDAFRQEVLITGEEDWAAMEAYCIPIVDRHTRACKSKSLLLSSHPDTIPSQSYPALNFNSESNSYPNFNPNPIQNPIQNPIPIPIQNPIPSPNQKSRQQFQSIKLCSKSLECLPQLPILVPYCIHLDDPTHKIMGNEMRFLGLLTNETITVHEQAAALQRTITIKPLPSNLTQIQIKALSGKVRKCERSALSGSVLYACIHCIMGGQQPLNRKGRKAFPTRGQCKLDLDTNDLICSICHNHSILSISALGRIISLKNHQFYLAPCCCTVQPYTARGDEFQVQFDFDNSLNSCHHKPSRPASKHTKTRCELCTNIALVEPHQAVDHLTGEPHTTHLCQRHTPHADALKHVANWRQLQEEIRKRDKPLFFHKRNALSGRRRGIDDGS